jgi:hypothetical protein
LNNKSQIENLLGGYLEGLILPEKASSISLMVWILGAVLLCLIIFSLWRWLQFRQQAKQRALRNLKVIDKGSSQVIALKLAKLLRQGLKVPRLSLFQTEEINKWAVFNKRLNSACYSTEPLGESEVQELIKQTRYWLSKS